MLGKETLNGEFTILCQLRGIVTCIQNQVGLFERQGISLSTTPLFQYLITCGKRDWKNNIMYLYGRIWHCSVDKVMDPIIQESKRLKCQPIKIEDIGDKGFLVREFLRKGAYASDYHESQNKFLKIVTYLKKWWPSVVFLEGTDREYIDQILDYTEFPEHDDAPDSAACVCRILEDGYH